MKLSKIIVIAQTVLRRTTTKINNKQMNRMGKKPMFTHTIEPMKLNCDNESIVDRGIPIYINETRLGNVTATKKPVDFPNRFNVANCER